MFFIMKGSLIEMKKISNQNVTNLIKIKKNKVGILGVKPRIRNRFWKLLKEIPHKHE